LLAATRGLPNGIGDEVYVPVRIAQVRFYRKPPPSFYCHARLTSAEAGRIVGDVILLDENGEILVEVHDVEARALTRNHEDALASIDNWLYAFDWRETAIPESQRGQPAQTWVVLAHEALATTGVELAARIEVDGNKAIVVTPQTYANGFINDNEVEIVMEAITGPEGHRVDGVVSLLSIGLDDSQIETRIEASTHFPLKLVQRLSASRTGRPVRLAFVTRHAQAIDVSDGAELSLAQTPLIGFARVAINEYPNLRTRLIDIDDTAPSLDGLVADIISTSEEDEVAWRAGRRHVNRLMRRSVAGLRDGEAISIPRFERGRGDILVSLENATVFSANGDTVETSHFCDALATVIAIPDGSRRRVGDRVLVSLPERPAALMWVRDELLSPVSEIDAGYASAVEIWRRYGLSDLTRSKIVLIHVDANPVALSLIRVAYEAGAVVVAVRPDTALDDVLMSLGAKHILDSHAADLRELLDEAVSVTRVGFSINATLSHIPLRHLWAVDEFGCHLELHYGDGKKPNIVPPFSLSYHTVNIVKLRQCEDVRPVPQTTFLWRNALQPTFWSEYELDHALKMVAQSPVMIASIDFEITSAQLRRSRAVTGTSFGANETYLVTGGFGGFGMKLASWLVDKGARNLVLVGRRGADTKASQLAVALLRERGATVLASATDVSDAHAVKKWSKLLLPLCHR